MRLRDTARRIHAVCRASLLALPLLCVPPAGAQSKGQPERGAAKAAACAACHGDGSRPPLPGTPQLDGQPAAFTALQLILIREGLRDIPQMAGLLKDYTDRDIEDVASYYQLRMPPKNGTRRDEARHARGAELARAMGCGSCHRADYLGQQQIPRLAGQREDYLVSAMKAYRDNKRTGSDTSMNGILYQVGDADIEALAHYLALQ